jgi:hypothetical protein
MEEDEYFIRVNIPALLSSPKVMAKTGKLGGEWKLHEIGYTHGTPRNIEFSMPIRFIDKLQFLI